MSPVFIPDLCERCYFVCKWRKKSLNNELTIISMVFK